MSNDTSLPASLRPNGYTVWLFNSDGTKRKPLPMVQVGEASWSISDDRGYEEFNVAVSAPGNAPFPGVAHGDRVEIWHGGRRRYRGYVRRPTLTLGEPITTGMSGSGLSQQIAKIVCNKRYVFEAETDIAVAIRALVQDFVVPLFPTLVVDVQATGYTITSVDATLKNFDAVMGDIVKIAGNLIVWGCDVCGDRDEDAADIAGAGFDRLYLRPITPAAAAADFALPVPGIQTASADARHDSANLMNRGVMVGGPPEFPNLVGNASFEYPAANAESTGNLLQNPSFTPRSGWTLSSGAAYKSSGHQEGPTYDGSDMIELDRHGEKVSQQQNTGQVIAGHDYTFGIYSRREATSNGAGGQLAFWFTGSGGAQVGDATFVSLNPASVNWDRFYDTVRAPAGATGYYIEAKMTAGDEAPTDHAGLLVDSAFLFDASRLAQSGWDLEAQGGSSVVTQDLARSADAYDGGYCVYVKAAGTNASGHPVRLRPVAERDQHIAAGQEVVIGIAHCRPPGASGGVASLRLGFTGVKDKGGDGYTHETDVFAVSQAGWQYQEFLFTAYDDSSASGHVYADIVADGPVLLDAFLLRDASTAGDPYQPDGPLVVYLRAADVCDAGTEQQASEATYGPWDGIIQNDSITDVATAREVFKRSFDTSAVPQTNPSIDRVDDTRDYWPGKAFRLEGEAGPALTNGKTLPIRTVGGSVDASGKLTEKLEGENPEPTIDGIVQQISGNQTRSAAGGGGIGSTAFAVASGGGGNFGGGTNSGSSSDGGTTAGVTTLNGLAGAVDIAEGAGLTVSAAAAAITVGIADGGVDTEQVADDAVTTAKVADGAVTSAKLSATGVAAGSVTNATLTIGADGRITSAASGSSSGAGGGSGDVTIERTGGGAGAFTAGILVHIINSAGVTAYAMDNSTAIVNVVNARTSGAVTLTAAISGTAGTLIVNGATASSYSLPAGAAAWFAMVYDGGLIAYKIN